MFNIGDKVSYKTDLNHIGVIMDIKLIGNSRLFYVKWDDVEIKYNGTAQTFGYVSKDLIPAV